MNYLAAQGIPKSKLNMGIPVYGQTFELSESNSAVGAPTNRGVPGAPGRLTLQAGMLAFNEICEYGNLKTTQTISNSYRTF